MPLIGTARSIAHTVSSRLTDLIEPFASLHLHTLGSKFWRFVHIFHPSEIIPQPTSNARTDIEYLFYVFGPHSLWRSLIVYLPLMPEMANREPVGLVGSLQHQLGAFL